MPSPDPLRSQDAAAALEQEACERNNPPTATKPAPSEPPYGTPAQLELVARAKRYIATRPSERISLAEVSAALEVSAPYLTAVFRRVEGVPLYRYLLRQRLKRALQLLQQRESVAHIAADLGFASHSHFSTAFGRAFNCVPSFFRARARAVCRTLHLRKRPD